MFPGIYEQMAVSVLSFDSISLF
uniref:Uncharacterized protein n=1 Tax=Moniliophthora roreri TaxID=221103 RepID=A0A0W0G0E6_MONRR